MLTNYFTDKEQLQFEILESKKFPIHKQSVIITFPDGLPRISGCCCKLFDEYLLSNIIKIEASVIEARK